MIADRRYCQVDWFPRLNSDNGLLELPLPNGNNCPKKQHAIARVKGKTVIDSERVATNLPPEGSRFDVFRDVGE